MAANADVLPLSSDAGRPVHSDTYCRTQDVANGESAVIYSHSSNALSHLRPQERSTRAGKMKGRESRKREQHIRGEQRPHAAVEALPDHAC